MNTNEREIYKQLLLSTKVMWIFGTLNKLKKRKIEENNIIYTEYYLSFLMIPLGVSMRFFKAHKQYKSYYQKESWRHKRK